MLACAPPMQLAAATGCMGQVQVHSGARDVRTTADEQLLAQDPCAAEADENEHHVEQADEVLGRQRTVRHVLRAHLVPDPGGRNNACQAHHVTCLVGTGVTLFGKLGSHAGSMGWRC